MFDPGLIQSFGCDFKPRFYDNFPGQTANKDILCGGDYVVLNVLSPRDLVFRPDLSDMNWTIIITKSRTFLFPCLDFARPEFFSVWFSFSNLEPFLNSKSILL